MHIEMNLLWKNSIRCGRNCVLSATTHNRSFGKIKKYGVVR
jgi:hypothetical protein